MVSILVMMQCNLAGSKINLHIAGIKSCRLPFCIVAIPLLSKALTVFVPAWNKRTLGGFRTMTLRSLTHQNRSNRWRSSKAKVSSLFVALTKLTIEFYSCLLHENVEKAWNPDMNFTEGSYTAGRCPGWCRERWHWKRGVPLALLEMRAVFPWGVDFAHAITIMHAILCSKWIDMIRYLYIYIHINGTLLKYSLKNYASKWALFSLTCTFRAKVDSPNPYIQIIQTPDRSVTKITAFSVRAGSVSAEVQNECGPSRLWSACDWRKLSWLGQGQKNDCGWNRK